MTERMQWVDAMRGFSMIVVVLGHVLLSMGIGGYSSFLSSVLLTFRMPLFFFVSGFFSYRLITWWNRERIADILKRKIQAQIICTIIFVSVYQYVIGRIDWLFTGFGGYWFTIVLFQMYLIYLLLSLTSRLISRNIVIPSMVLLSVLFVALLVMFRGSSWAWNFFSWENLTKYMQFFTIGIICSKYREKLFKLLREPLFSTIVIVGWIICMLLWYNDTFKITVPYLYSFIHDVAVRYFALFTVILCFYRASDYLSSNSVQSKTLRLIGQRTLDIYMIHYFFLPSLSFMEQFLTDGNMLVVQLLISTIITTIIVFMSLLVSTILRESPILSSWLFGTKNKQISLSQHY